MLLKRMSTRTHNVGADSDEPRPPLVKTKRPKGARSLALTSVAIAREQRRQSDMRREDRNPFREFVQVRFRGRDWDAALINMSSGGAMIEIGLAPNIAEPMVLNLDPDGSDCAVRWVKASRVGLEFTHDVRPRPIDQSRGCRSETVESFDERSEANNLADKATGESGIAARPFLNGAGDAIDGSHRWTACLRSIAASELPFRSSARFRLTSETILDLSSSGIMTATISWSAGGRADPIY